MLVVDGFPVGLGVDAAGVVVKVGEQAGATFKVGDEVCGCTRLGTRGHNTAQEFFLMDAQVAIPKPKNITPQQAATGGNFTRVFDAVAGDAALPRALFKELNAQGKVTGQKYFATTNDWSGIGDFEGGKTYLVRLGPVGRPDAKELNARIASFIPTIVGLIEQDHVSPSAYDIVGQGGMEDAIEAYKYHKAGAGGANKVLVKIQDK